MYSELVLDVHADTNSEQEASLADITYLFESGALVDFTPDELVHLLFALFTDTPLRRDVISKITASRRSSV